MEYLSLCAISGFEPDRPPARSAWLGHLHFAAWIVGQLKPGLVVELGTQYGHSYFAFCKAVAGSALPTRCLAVDTWDGEGADGHYNEAAYAFACAHNTERYAHFSTLLRMDFDAALAHVAEASVDLLHIDGRHDYDSVRHDFESWLPKLAPGAVVLFHDTAEQREGFGVWRFWRELGASYPWRLEFRHSHGLGVLQVSPGKGGALPGWLRPGSADQRLVADFFGALGALEQERQAVDVRRREVSQDRRLAALERRFARRLRLIGALAARGSRAGSLEAQARLAWIRAEDAWALAGDSLARAFRLRT